MAGVRRQRLLGDDKGGSRTLFSYRLRTVVDLSQFTGSKLNHGEVAVGTANQKCVAVGAPGGIIQIRVVQSSNDGKRVSVKGVVDENAVPGQDAKDGAVGETGQLILLGRCGELEQNWVGTNRNRGLMGEKQAQHDGKYKSKRYAAPDPQQ